MTEQVSKNWKVFKEKFMSQYKDAPPYIVDYIAIEDILLSHVSGNSSEKICETYQLSPEYVKIVLEEYLKVFPRENTLNFNPYKVYKNASVGKETFLAVVKLNAIEEDAESLYEACNLFCLIQQEIEDFYRKWE